MLWQVTKELSEWIEQSLGVPAQLIDHESGEPRVDTKELQLILLWLSVQGLSVRHLRNTTQVGGQLTFLLYPTGGSVELRMGLIEKLLLGAMSSGSSVEPVRLEQWHSLGMSARPAVLLQKKFDVRQERSQPAPPVQHLVIVQEPGLTRTGRLLDRMRAGRAGVFIRASGQQRAVLTDAEGRFTILSEEGAPPQVVVEHPEASTFTIEWETLAN